ncbi:MAG TPA: hypothetical protein VGE28_10380 [Pseudomonas sp.]
MNEKTALSLLRADPGNACHILGFLVVPDTQLATHGGPCNITARQVDDNVFELVATHGNGRDFFFPYRPQGVGQCMVPGNCPTGTIVLTGGMNGCSLQVERQANGSYVFQHDANGKYLQPQATTRCRIDYQDYAGPLTSDGVGLGIHRALGKFEGKANRYPQNTLISVKEEKGWGIYTCCIVTYTEPKTGILSSLFGKTDFTTRHGVALPSRSPCIVRIE